MPVSPKVLAGSFGAAVATLFWVIAAATFWEGTFTDTELSALVGATATVVASLLGYLVPDPLRGGVAVVSAPTVVLGDGGASKSGPPVV